MNLWRDGAGGGQRQRGLSAGPGLGLPAPGLHSSVLQKWDDPLSGEEGGRWGLEGTTQGAGSLCPPHRRQLSLGKAGPSRVGKQAPQAMGLCLTLRFPRGRGGEKDEAAPSGKPRGCAIEAHTGPCSNKNQSTIQL